MPRSSQGTNLPLSEDFARWRDDPITRLVFRALEAAEQAQKDQWQAASWGGGQVRADDLKDTLQELRVRADAYAALREMTIEDVTTWLGIEHAE
jgi:hypothetical protein